MAQKGGNSQSVMTNPTGVAPLNFGKILKSHTRNNSISKTGQPVHPLNRKRSLSIENSGRKYGGSNRSGSPGQEPLRGSWYAMMPSGYRKPPIYTEEEQQEQMRQLQML